MLSAEGKPLPINDNLEAMAKQLYDYWFVQFDFPNEEGKPYKSSGGAMVWNDKLKREIPQGWDSSMLQSICTIKRGASPRPIDDFMDESHKGMPWVKISDATNSNSPFMTTIKEYIILDGVPKSVKVIPNTLIVSNSATPGIPKFIQIEACVHDGWLVLTDYQEIYKYYLYYVIKMIMHNLLHIASGSIFKNLKTDYLKEFICITPSTEILSKYHNLVKPIMQEILLLQRDTEVLTKQRDELLPLLMNGQATVNYHLSVLFLSSLILYRDQYKFYNMKETIIQAVLDGMRAVLTENQLELLTDVTRKALSECEITPKATEEEQRNKENAELLGAFISSKKVEGCSDKTIHYYKSSIEKLIATVKKNVCDIATNDIRCYLAEQQEQRGLSKVTIDNLRRIYSSFFSWLEDEDYITKSPVRRIHKVRTDALVKEVLTDENIEVLRDSCQELRDIAMIDLLLSTGMRVGELVKINRDDIDFQERQCVVFGKGNKEREVYFNARTKIHLKKYLEQRTDTNPALFVSLHEPHTRLTISGVEVRLRQLGKRVNLNKVHPHKFRRTLATMAIDKGMPIEQVQKMLGHVKIDTTLHYAMVNQTNVKIAHRKFLN